MFRKAYNKSMKQLNEYINRLAMLRVHDIGVTHDLHSRSCFVAKMRRSQFVCFVVTKPSAGGEGADDAT